MPYSTGYCLQTATADGYLQQPGYHLLYIPCLTALGIACRRLLQMGIYNTEIFNNLGLCCFYSQQYDMTLSCFERAISLASDEALADVWFNVGHVALVITDQLIPSATLIIAEYIKVHRLNP